ncbi:MAG: hypothetical protein H0W70_11360, partial [Actinobacteria bacterium]|nr:hypothetical protein [Actinomycetota bacterium]
MAIAGAYGVYLVYTSVALGWRGLAVGPKPSEARTPRPRPVEKWLSQAGLG